MEPNDRVATKAPRGAGLGQNTPSERQAPVNPGLPPIRHLRPLIGRLLVLNVVVMRTMTYASQSGIPDPLRAKDVVRTGV